MAEPHDFTTTSPRALRTQLLGLPPTALARFFADAGVPLQVAPLGKLFPADGRRARDVLGALHQRLDDAGVTTRFGTPVTTVAATDGAWLVDDEPTAGVVVATGGRSVPATGSTGFGLDLAAHLGHELMAQVPALAPLHGDTPWSWPGSACRRS